MIRALLVDDEPPARARLRQLLQEAGDVLVVGEAGDVEEARAAIDTTRPDVVFLDIEMPVVRGTDFAASLPPPRPFIVFATAYDRFALDAFAVDATDYLLKPVTRGRLGGTLARVRARLASRTDLDKEMSAASAVQARLLGRPMPVVPGLACAGVTEPAGGVGGDFFDVFTLDRARVAVVLGDASGKGLPASLIASSVQARIHTAARHATDPRAMLAAVSDDVCATSSGDRYATAVYGEIDLAAWRLRLVNAGHGAALVVGPDGQPTWLPSTGPVIGLMEGVSYGMHHAAVAPGSLLVLVSDGITDAFDDQGAEFGDARLLATVAGVAREAPARVAEAITSAARAHRGARGATDDATVLVIRMGEA
ncbi:MAG: SpoIIE family protein phosphatase [Acidobacteriota bacterium]